MTGLNRPRAPGDDRLGVSRWENLRQPAGVRSTSFKHSASDPNRLTAYVTFDAQGVSGQSLGGRREATRSSPPATDDWV